MAFLLGVLNLFRVHLSRVVDQKRDWPYSLALTFAAALVFLVALWEQGTGGPIMGWIFNSTLLPLETASRLAVGILFSGGRLSRFSRPADRADALCLSERFFWCCWRPSPWQ